MTEFNFIDGQALDPTDFGEFDDNGTWKPLAYTGTYGTNGFYLNGVGVTDESGNGNDWTNNNLNLSTSTDTTYDQMKDTPSLVDTNAGNFAVIESDLEMEVIAVQSGNLSCESIWKRIQQCNFNNSCTSLRVLVRRIYSNSKRALWRG
jgi:hypothetical protein